MNITEHEFTLVASDLQKSNIGKATIDLLRRIIDQNLSSRLVESLIERQAMPDRYEAISRTMQNLEMLAETDQTLACILMSDLWSFAGNEIGMHDVCDAIDLWIWHCHSIELQRHLRALASSERDPDIRRHFEELIERKPD